MSFKQLKLLYEKLYNTSLEIEALIAKHEYEEAFEIVQRRNFMTTKIEEIIKMLPDGTEIPEDINELKAKLKIKEENNLINLTQTRDFVKTEIEKSKKKKKLVNAYSQNLPSKSRIVDITE